MIPKNVQMPNPNPKYKPPGTPTGGRGGNLMEIEKLIEILRGKCAVCKRSSCNGKYWQLSSCPATCEAADALEQLQAENDRLRRERDDAIRQLRFFAPCAGCKWYRGIKGCAHERGCDTNHDYYEFVAKED